MVDLNTETPPTRDLRDLRKEYEKLAREFETARERASSLAGRALVRVMRDYFDLDRAQVGALVAGPPNWLPIPTSQGTRRETHLMMLAKLAVGEKSTASRVAKVARHLQLRQRPAEQALEEHGGSFYSLHNQVCLELKGSPQPRPLPPSSQKDWLARQEIGEYRAKIYMAGGEKVLEMTPLRAAKKAPTSTPLPANDRAAADTEEPPLPLSFSK